MKATKDQTNQLFQSFCYLENAEEVKKFMTDLCTPAEIKAFTERWAIAQLLDQTDMSYRDIASEIGASTTTVARVARFLRQEPHQGYRIVLERQSK